MHPRALGALARFRVAEMVARDIDEAPLRSAPALCLLYAEALDAETFLRGGACFEEIALDVTEAGLAMALHSAPVEVGLSPPRPAAPVGARRVARRHRRDAPRAAGRVRRRAAGRAGRLLPARVADPRARAPEPAAPAARASARDRSLPGDDPAQPALAQPARSRARCARCGSWSRAAAASAGRRSCRWSGWGWSGSSCASRVTTSSTTSTARPPTWATSAGTRPRCRRTGPGPSTRRSRCWSSRTA